MMMTEGEDMNDLLDLIEERNRESVYDAMFELLERYGIAF